MTITTKTGVIGFLLALSALNPSQAKAKLNQPAPTKNYLTVESRLAALSALVKEQEAQLLDSADKEKSFAQQWGNWLNGGGRFSNIRPPWRNWPNYWRDVRPFSNFRNFHNYRY